MSAAHWIALVGAASLGSLLTALLNHWLSRGNRRVDLADKSIRLADAAVGMSEAQLARAQQVIENLQRQVEELQGQLAEGDDLGGTPDKVAETLQEIGSAREELAGLRIEFSPDALEGLAVALPPPHREALEQTARDLRRSGESAGGSLKKPSVSR